MSGLPPVRRILQAMRADAIPAMEAGGWWISKRRRTGLAPEGGYGFAIPGPDTYLHREIHGGGCSRGTPGWDCVMHDRPSELALHLEPIHRAHGRVLVTGLGLGCVLRGLLLNPAVTWVDVVERSPEVIQAVAPYLPNGRWMVHEAEALAYVEATTQGWDFAWHDLWSEPALEEPNLQVTHGRLMAALADRVPAQGAWAFPRTQRRLFERVGVSMRGRKRTAGAPVVDSGTGRQ